MGVNVKFIKPIPADFFRCAGVCVLVVALAVLQRIVPTALYERREKSRNRASKLLARVRKLLVCLEVLASASIGMIIAKFTFSNFLLGGLTSIGAAHVALFAFWIPVAAGMYGIMTQLDKVLGETQGMRVAGASIAGVLLNEVYKWRFSMIPATALVLVAVHDLWKESKTTVEKKAALEILDLCKEKDRGAKLLPWEMIKLWRLLHYTAVNVDLLEEVAALHQPNVLKYLLQHRPGGHESYEVERVKAMRRGKSALAAALAREMGTMARRDKRS